MTTEQKPDQPSDRKLHELMDGLLKLVPTVAKETVVHFRVGDWKWYVSGVGRDIVPDEIMIGDTLRTLIQEVCRRDALQISTGRFRVYVDKDDMDSWTAGIVFEPLEWFAGEEPSEG